MHLIGRPARSTNQRPGFLTENSLNSCPDSNLKKIYFTKKAIEKKFMNIPLNHAASTVPTAEKLQQLPQCPWFFTGVIMCFQSTESGASSEFDLEYLLWVIGSWP